MKDKIQQALEAKGYQVRFKEREKNGNMLKYVSITRTEFNGITPCVYYERIMADKELTPEEIADIIIEMTEKSPKPNIDTDLLTDKEYILEHCKMALQRNTETDYVKKPFKHCDKIECYLYISDSLNNDSDFTVKLRKPFIEQLGIDIEELWERAEINTLSKVQNYTVGIFPYCYIVTLKGNYKGAVAVLDDELIENIADELEADKLICIPSSIHEMMLINYDEYKHIDIDEFVRDVNRTLPQEDVLIDETFIIEVQR